MDILRLDLVAGNHGGQLVTCVEILVNGRPLAALTRTVELPHAMAEGHPRLAGDYAPLALSDIRSERGHFLGEPVATWFEDGDTVLMGCPCGEWGCWPLTVLVDVSPTTIRWHNFRNGHRDWDLGSLGPFSFGRRQYETALAVLTQH